MLTRILIWLIFGVAVVKLAPFFGDFFLILLFIGAVAGWLAGLLVGWSGVGMPGDIVIGIIGVFVGSWLTDILRIDWLLANALGIHIYPSIMAAIVAGTVGAVVLIVLLHLLLRLFRRT